MIVISDTTPLSNLLQIGEIDLLPQLFTHIIIPTLVFEELSILKKRGFAIDALKTIEWLTVQSPGVQSNQIIKELQDLLDPGESHAIALAIELQADYLLMDEKEGRRVARTKELPIIGTLGVLLEAKQEGLISSVREKMDALRAIHCWIGEELYQQVLKLAKE